MKILNEIKFNNVDLIPKKKYKMVVNDFPDLPPRIVRYVGIFNKNGAIYHKFTDLKDHKSFNLYQRHFIDYGLTILD
jgi:hypothetical protein